MTRYILAISSFILGLIQLPPADGWDLIWIAFLFGMAVVLILKPALEAVIFIICAALDTTVGTGAASKFNALCHKWLGVGV